MAISLETINFADMITAYIKTQVRKIQVPCADNRDKAIEALQNAVYSLNSEDGRCRFVVLDKNHNQEIYSWEYQPTFRPDLVKKEVEKVDVKEEESKYDWGCVIYILKNGKEMDWDNFYRDSWDCVVDFDDEKSAHEFMRKRGYDQTEYRLVYEYTVWEKGADTTYPPELGFTKKEARENLNINLKHYNLKLLANGKVKEI